MACHLYHSICIRLDLQTNEVSSLTLFSILPSVRLLFVNVALPGRQRSKLFDICKFNQRVTAAVLNETLFKTDV